MLDPIKKLFPNHIVSQTLGSMHGEYADKQYKKLVTLHNNEIFSIHRYLDEGNQWSQYPIVRGPIDELASNAAFVGNELVKNNPKPVVINEIGAVDPDHSGPFNLYEKDKEGVLIHDMIFAPFFSGSAGSGGIWHWNQYIYSQNLWYHFQRFQRAINGVDPISEKFEPTYFEENGVRCYVLNGKSTTIIWCRDTVNNWETELRNNVPANPKNNFSINLKALKNSNYKQYRIYDPWNDKWESYSQIANFQVSVPPFIRSVIIKLEK